MVTFPKVEDGGIDPVPVAPTRDPVVGISTLGAYSAFHFSTPVTLGVPVSFFHSDALV